MKTTRQGSFKTKNRSKAILALLGLATSLNLGWAAVPSLPLEFQTGKEKAPSSSWVLLDFFSDYCGTCQMMAPHLGRIQKEMGSFLKIFHIDAADESAAEKWKDFNIEGTPTYVLYSPSGQAVYKMEERISPLVLEKQLQRLHHDLKPVDFPTTIALPPANPDTNNPLGNLILLSFDKPDCQACQKAAPVLDAFEMSGNAGLHVLHIQADSSAGQDLMKTLKLTTLPAYALVDNSKSASSSSAPADSETHQRGLILTQTGNIPPHDLWELIRLFSNAGV